MARIPATKKELKKSFRFHYLVYQKISKDETLNPITRRLILFYSVESGLKCFILNRMQKNSTEELEDYQGYNNPDGHDIRELIKIAHIGDQENFQLKTFISQKIGKIEPKQLHQIWRYGIETNDSDNENRSEKILQNVANWLNSRI